MVADNLNILDIQPLTAQRFEYDFAVDGGAIGDIVLRGGQIPGEATLTQATTKIISGFTSGGATVLSATVESADDFSSANSYSAGNAPAAASALGIAGATPIMLFPAVVDNVTAGMNIINTTQARNLVMTIAGAPLTGGKFVTWINVLQ